MEGDWAIYYCQLPREIKSISNDQINIQAINGNFFRISPTSSFQPLLPGDSIIVRFAVTGDVPNISQVPEGAYWVKTEAGKETAPLPVSLSIATVVKDLDLSNNLALHTYENNSQLTTAVLSATDILPSVKSFVADTDGATLTFPKEISLEYSNELANEGAILRDKLKSLFGIEISENAPMTFRLDLSTDTASCVGKEGYQLKLGSKSVLIEGLTAHGVFNGINTLLSLLKQQTVLPCGTVTDYPDLEYRGVMLDIARNFTQPEDLKKLISLLSSYKINVLHLHFADDEGWRLEIPGLEELTEVGARRGHTTNESLHLFPGYDGGFDPDAATSGNGFYTREQFIDLLRFASRHHVRVIPEVEAPAHARAAIVSMKARYNKYASSDLHKATEYLLSEKIDKSVYCSAQSYSDNVMNVALPSTYRFVEKVINEISEMYREAGAELPVIHIGGDEVPKGAWESSPACRKFMQEHGMTNVHELSEYYFCRIADLLQRKGIKSAGWQEVALKNAPYTDTKLKQNSAGVYCWNTVAEWGDDEIPYRIANAGYPVVLCNVTNFYLDLAYSSHFNEWGHSWAGTVDEAKSFSMLPYSIYRSARTNLSGESVDLGMSSVGKEPLRIPGNIKGVQGQLFTETIRNFPMVEYYVFPKIFGLVERGWNVHPKWETLEGKMEAQAFNADLSKFYTLLCERELPYLKTLDVNFRLPHPGLMLKDGYLYANSPLHKAQIRFTTDGSEPTASSSLWSKPVKCSAPIVKAKLFYLGRESVTSTLSNTSH